MFIYYNEMQIIFFYHMELWIQTDKDGANPERVMQELSSVGLMPEIWGGDVPMVPVAHLL